MKLGIYEHHCKDNEGHPAGGTSAGVGIDVTWQNGPLSVNGERKEQNGAFVEDVIAIAVGRLKFYQGTMFVCRENALAITKLEEALFARLRFRLGHNTLGHRIPSLTSKLSGANIAVFLNRRELK